MTVEIDARGLFTDEIRDITMVLPANLLKTGNYSLKDEEVVGNGMNIPQQTISLSGFKNVDAGFEDRKYVIFNTVVP